MNEPSTDTEQIPESREESTFRKPSFFTTVVYFSTIAFLVAVMIGPAILFAVNPDALLDQLPTVIKVFFIAQLFATMGSVFVWLVGVVGLYLARSAEVSSFGAMASEYNRYVGIIILLGSAGGFIKIMVELIANITRVSSNPDRKSVV